MSEPACSTPIRLSPDILRRNLDALSHVDPALAEQIRRFDPVGGGWQLARTRDGRISYQRCDAEGHVCWLGRSSLPGVRAEALLEQFDPGRANVLIPQVAEGSEMAALLRRLGGHRAVFVWEPDAGQLALVLRLHDVADAIRAERLVLICCQPDEVADRLLNWLRHHPGHLCPERLMMWPWQTLAELAVLRGAVESVLRTIGQERRAELQDLASRRRGVDQTSRPNGIAILGLHARESVWQVGEALAAAASANDQKVALALLRGPGDVHPLALARRLDAANLHLTRAILLEITRRSVRDMLDERTPAVSWISPSGGIPADLPQQVGSADHIAVTCATLREEALATGVPAQRVHVIPPACWSELPDDAISSRVPGLVLMADLASPDPQAHGVHLPTHRQLWQVVMDDLQTHIDGFSLRRLPALLERAEQRTRMSVGETTVRQTMLRGLQSAAQAVYCSFIAKKLRELEVTLRIIGSGWKTPPADDPASATWSRRADIASRATAVLHLDLTGTATAEALLAASHGALLIALATPFDDEPGGLATLLKRGDEYIPFKTLRDLLGSLEQLAREPARGLAIIARARTRCRREHSPAARLAALDAILSS